MPATMHTPIQKIEKQLNLQGLGLAKVTWNEQRNLLSIEWNTQGKHVVVENVLGALEAKKGELLEERNAYSLVRGGKEMLIGQEATSLIYAAFNSLSQLLLLQSAEFPGLQEAFESVTVDP